MPVFFKSWSQINIGSSTWHETSHVWYAKCVYIVVVKYHGYLNISRIHTYSTYLTQIYVAVLAWLFVSYLRVYVSGPDLLIWARYINLAQEVCMFKMGMALWGHRVGVVTSWMLKLGLVGFMQRRYDTITWCHNNEFCTKRNNGILHRHGFANNSLAKFSERVSIVTNKVRSVIVDLSGRTPSCRRRLRSSRNTFICGRYPQKASREHPGIKLHWSPAHPVLNRLW